MPENKYQVVMNGSTYDITEDGVTYKVVKDNKPYGSINLSTASKEAITAFQLGIFFGTSQVLDRMQEQTAGVQNQYGQMPQNYPSNYVPNPNYSQGQVNPQGVYQNPGVQPNMPQGYYQPVQPMPYNSVEAPDNGQGMNQGSSNKTLTLTSGHSILGNDNSANPVNNNWMQGGFANKLIMSLIVGFGLGVITTAVYIFINLGKITINL